MIHILIDNQPVSLSTDISFELYKRNPLFTKEGEHSFNIDINLTDPNNAKLYKHIYRKDVSAVIKNRTAVILDGPKCIFRGSEVILSVTDEVAKIQLVSGNSELNYLSGGNIRDLDFGTIDVTTEKARQSLSSSYPSFNYVCCPVLANTDNNLFGDGSKYYNQVDTMADQQNPVTMDNATLRAQPYLMFYIEKTIELLGYKVGENVLKSEQANKIVCINGLDTNSYADILPNWSIADFITHIEMLFNVIFVVDNAEKKVNILRTSTYYENKPYITINAEDVVNEYEKTFDVESDIYTNYTNVKYKLPEGIEYYQFADIDPEIVKLCEFRTNRLWDFDIPEDTFNKCIIYQDQFFKNKHVYRIDNSAGTVKFYQHMMYLQRVVNDPNDEEFVELEIIPAEIYLRENGDFNLFTVPLARNVLEVSDSSQNKQGLIDYIKDGITEIQPPNHLFIAFYEGYQNYFISVDGSTGESVRSSSAYRIPMCRTTPFHHGSYNIGDAAFYAVYPDKDTTLQLDGEHGLYNKLYKDNPKVNKRTEYKFSFLRKGQWYEPTDIFLIGNQPYFCEELKYNMESKGCSEVVEGTFFRIE